MKEIHFLIKTRIDQLAQQNVKQQVRWNIRHKIWDKVYCQSVIHFRQPVTQAIDLFFRKQYKK